MDDQVFCWDEGRILSRPIQKGGLGAKPKNVHLVSKRIAEVIKALNAHIMGIVDKKKGADH